MMSNYGVNFRAPKVDVHSFAMIPRADIPRSSFVMQHQHKTTIQSSVMSPIYVQECLPGDSFNVSVAAFVRMATPIYPVLDNMDIECFFFFVPNRLVWYNWYKFMGEQDQPTDSISFTIPQIVSPVGGFAPTSIYDYMGIPCSGQTAAGQQVSVNALPFRAYNLIYNQWFRDENLCVSQGFGTANIVGYNAMDNGPDPYTNYILTVAGKRHDYFTSCLPWTQKGNTAVTLPLGSSATVRTAATDIVGAGVTNPALWKQVAGGAIPPNNLVTFGTSTGFMFPSSTAGTTAGNSIYPTNLYADLSTATAATINQIRLAFQTQKLLERDARGGTRYTEIIRSHFGVVSPDARLQRPEYLGGGKFPVSISPVPQTTGTGASGQTTPLGTLSAVGTSRGNVGFRQSFTEHGYIIGIVVPRASQVYQQGIRKLFSRSTRYDFYFPVFAMLGEQSVLNREIYSDGSANDALTFGYQERWAEYRYMPSRTSAYFRSTNPTPLDAWHLGTKFTSLPALNQTFIQDNTSLNVQRVVAAGAAANQQQFLCDFLFTEKVARPMPMYSVPGLVDHF